MSVFSSVFCEKNVHFLYKYVQDLSAFRWLTELGSLKQESFFVFVFSSTWLHSELPAETCAEIKASEGKDAVSGNYWLSSIKPGEEHIINYQLSAIPTHTHSLINTGGYIKAKGLAR